MDISTQKLSTLQKAVEWVKNHGYSKIRSTTDDFETPISYSQKSTDVCFTPDITAFSKDRKFYFEVALKSDAVQTLSSKWQLLSRLASMKEGKLIIMAPHGHKAFAERLLMQNQIEAQVISI